MIKVNENQELAIPSSESRAYRTPFIITCPECGGTGEPDAYLKTTPTTFHQVTPYPMIVCLNCEYEWNPQLLNI
jgi:hypothetical protein